jgi:hypothetical protein
VLPVSPEVWYELSEEVPEDLGAKFCAFLWYMPLSYSYSRLSYLANIEKLIVTWPTALRESFKWPARPFSNLTNALPDRFVWDTNIDIPLPGSNTTTTPDFAFGKFGANGATVYPIIIESAYSQIPERLEEKANKHLTRPEVACVVGLDFTTPTFEAPKTRPLAGAKVMSQPEFNVAANAVDKSLLGPIKVGNDVWAPAIERIELAMWCKKPGTVSQYFVPFFLHALTNL